MGWLDPDQVPKLPYTGVARRLADSDAHLEGLLTACRTGQLSNVVSWIKSGRPLQVDREQAGRRPQWSALSTAIETGQYDLVRLLLASGCRPELERQSPFDLVLRSRRWDLLELLFRASADPNTVDPDAVFGTYSRETMERFFSMGVDLAGNGALAMALAYETSNMPLFGFVKNHTDDTAIQGEVDVALGCAIGRQNDKAVSLCLWSGANPRNTVPVMGDGHEPSDDWTMTAFERAIWSRAPQYLKNLGFDPESDDIDALYDVAYHAREVEALAAICPPSDWHTVTERLLDHVLFSLELRAGSGWGSHWELERVFKLGGHLRQLSGSTTRRLRKYLKGLQRGDAKRWLRLLEQHMDTNAFLDLVGHPAFLDDYQGWGLKKGTVEALAAGEGGAKAAAAKARRILKAERERPPTVHVPWNRDDYICLTREELFEVVWSSPIIHAAKRFGLSDNGLRKACKKLGVPTPPRGYWAASRKRRRPTRLPAAKPGWPTEAWLPRPRKKRVAGEA